MTACCLPVRNIVIASGATTDNSVPVSLWQHAVSQSGHCYCLRCRMTSQPTQPCSVMGIGANFWKWPWGQDPPPSLPLLLPVASAFPASSSHPHPLLPISLSSPVASPVSFPSPSPCPYPLNPATGLDGTLMNASGAFSGWNRRTFFTFVMTHSRFYCTFWLCRLQWWQQNSRGDDLGASPPQLFGCGGDHPMELAPAVVSLDSSWQHYVTDVCVYGCVSLVEEVARLKCNDHRIMSAGK